MFDERRKRRNFRMFEKIARPCSIAVTIVAKLSPANTLRCTEAARAPS
jgi:hypothetical protein